MKISLVPHCFSSSLYLYGKDSKGRQKYLCRLCFSQFTTASFSPRSSFRRLSSKGYPSCPVCGRGTFLWHRYPSYLHFKCNSKKSGHSIKIPVSRPASFVYHPSVPTPSFKRFRFPAHIIIFSISLYFHGPYSLRQIKQFLFDRFNVYVSHVSILKWIRHFAPFAEALSNHLLSKGNFSSDEWNADETYIKIRSVEHYLWILFDSETRCVISFKLSDNKASTTAQQVFQKAKNLTKSEPQYIITDGLDSYNMAIKNEYPNTVHHIYKEFKEEQNNNIIESFNNIFKDWYKRKRGFNNFKSAEKLITQFIFYYNFIRRHSALNNNTPAQVAGIQYREEQRKNWFLI